MRFECCGFEAFLFKKKGFEAFAFSFRTGQVLGEGLVFQLVAFKSKFLAPV
jgi:hypothetical protein